MADSSGHSAHFADADRGLQPEVQYCFSRDSYARAASGALGDSPRRGPRQGADSRALAAAGNRADNGAEDASTTGEFRGTLVGPHTLASLFDEVARFESILPSVHTHCCDVNR